MPGVAVAWLTFPLPSEGTSSTPPGVEKATVLPSGDQAGALASTVSVGELIQSLGDKLNPYRGQLQNALEQLRMAFVQLSP